MRKAWIVTVALSLAAYAASSQRTQPVLQSPTLAVTNVTLLDGTGGPARRNVTVLIRGARVAAITPARAFTLSPGTRQLDGRGKFLLPGLCDAHAHIRHGTRTLELFIAHGVTCIRQMFDDMQQIRVQREGIERGELLGPRFLTIAGGWPDSVTGDRATAVADSLRSLGATFFKIGTTITPESFQALRREAARLGMPFLGHLPLAVPLSDLIASEMRSIEHMAFLELSFTTKPELRDSILATITRNDAAARAAFYAQTLATVSAARRDSLLRLMAARRLWITPTLVNHQRAAMAGDSAFESDPRLRDIAESTKVAWRQSRYARPRTAEQRALAKSQFAFQRALVRRMSELGVPILAGSDAGDVYNYDGSSLHDELRLLVDAGLPTAKALDAVTRAPVVAAGAQDSLGTVEVGKVADLVLIDADPRTDIRNLTRLAAVVLGGKVIDRDSLRSLRLRGR
ncbi:MAG TPA: amidohydrolase family protein [Gemmatimonadaceae bacterium]|nr:amidohydrolase family protein [Gemmatimonadaceae bacterium]